MTLRNLLSRVWWVPVFAATVGSAALVVNADTGDLPYFVHAADRLLAPGWADVYADPDLQVGPVQLLVLAFAASVAGTLAVSTFTVLAFAVPLAVLVLLLLALRSLLAGRPERRWLVLLLAGLAAAAVGIPASAYADGHMAQAVVPLLWLLAGLRAREGSVVGAGVLVGLSAGFELWGMLGAVMLLLAPRLRLALAGVAVQLVVVVGLLAPFVFLGDFRMFEYHWVVNPDTVLGLFVEPGSEFTWRLRLVQGGAAFAAGAVLAWPLRRTLHGVWLAPLAVVAVRLALDPVRYPWYWLALETLALVGAVEFLTSDAVRRIRAARFNPTG